jgi:catechol 2,3-dioxygenase-like lactoylglutathione lyase family enzyme
MLAHVSIGVRQLDRALRFYDAALATLGYQRHYTYGEGAGYGPDRHNIQLWINVYHRQDQRPHAASSGAHYAFNADTRLAVDAFYAVALRNGGRDNGKPGLRTQYAPNYYGAFVFDPDGNHVEAVCFVAAAPQAINKPVEKAAAKPEETKPQPAPVKKQFAKAPLKAPAKPVVKSPAKAPVKAKAKAKAKVKSKPAGKPAKTKSKSKKRK